MANNTLNSYKERTDYVNWLTSGINIVAFKRYLILKLGVGKPDADNMCEFLDKEENGFIDYRNFITVISDFNKYDP